MGPFTSAASVMMAPDGHIWVLRSRAAGDPNPKYDIIDGSGRVVAEARLRPGSSVIAFGADNAVYVVRTDPDTDLQQVEMYRRP